MAFDAPGERLLFYYSPFSGSDDYWNYEGKKWSQSVDSFAKDSDVISAAVSKIVSPKDTDAAKVQKIYEAVMGLENTDYTRTHSFAENRAEGMKEKNAGDIWQAKQGSSDEITKLLIALVRAAGLKAYAMRVCDRRNEIFVKSFLDWDQFDNHISIVVVNGKEMHLDPGEQYEDFGELAWFHTMTGGIRQAANGTELALTPGGQLQVVDGEPAGDADGRAGWFDQRANTGDPDGCIFFAASARVSEGRACQDEAKRAGPLE